MKKIVEKSVLKQFFDIYERKYKNYYYSDDYLLDSKITSWTYKCTLTGEELLHFLTWYSFDSRINNTIQIRRYNSHSVLSKSTIIDYFYQFQYQSFNRQHWSKKHARSYRHSYRHIREHNYCKKKLSQREINEIRNDYSFARVSLKNDRIMSERQRCNDYKLRTKNRCWKDNSKNKKQYMRHYS